jgi:hypothetical protein
MRIIALDPGGTTGVATYETEHQIWDHCQIGPAEHHNALWNYLTDTEPDVIIYERFMYQRRELTRGVTLNLDAVEYIGVVKLWYSQHVNVELVCQTPHQAKMFWDDEKLKTVGLYITGAPHANDATRHLLYYLTFRSGDTERDKWMKRLQPPSDSGGAGGGVNRGPS